MHLWEQEKDFCKWIQQKIHAECVLSTFQTTQEFTHPPVAGAATASRAAMASGAQALASGACTAAHSAGTAAAAASAGQHSQAGLHMLCNACKRTC